MDSKIEYAYIVKNPILIRSEHFNNIVALLRPDAYFSSVEELNKYIERIKYNYGRAFGSTLEDISARIKKLDGGFVVPVESFDSLCEKCQNNEKTHYSCMKSAGAGNSYSLIFKNLGLEINKVYSASEFSKKVDEYILSSRHKLVI